MVTYPTLSIVTPTRNARKTLGQTIESIDSYGDDTEHLVIDEHSQDGTRELVECHPRSKLAATGVEGISKAMNVGIKLSTGKFVLILNADDQLHRDFTEVLHSLRTAPDDTIYHANAIQYDPVTKRSFEIETNTRDLPKYMSIVHSSLFVPRQIYETMGCYSEDYMLAMDSEFVHRCLNKVKFEHIDLISSEMRLRGRSHIATTSAMQEYKRSVLHHKLQGPIKAEFYRLRQTVLHSLLKISLMQHLWTMRTSR